MSFGKLWSDVVEEELSGFRFSDKSLAQLASVKRPLREVAMRALQLSKVDFGITQGLRTIEEQRRLVAEGKSKTMNSKHLTGDAVDVVMFVPSQGYTYEPVSGFVMIADAFKAAAGQLKTKIRWGGAWHIENFTTYYGDAQEATDEYVALKRSLGQKPFLDLVHFELGA
jgi:hypothetical protein